MSTVPPVSGPPAATVSSGETPALTVPRPPPSVAALSAGTTIDAVVSAATRGTNIELTSAFGSFRATANIPLRIDQPVQLLVATPPSASQAVVLHVLSIAGKSLATGALPGQGSSSPILPGDPSSARVPGAALAGANPKPGELSSARPTASPPTVSLSVGQSVTAVLLGGSTISPTVATALGTGPQSTTPTQSAPTAAGIPLSATSSVQPAATSGQPIGQTPGQPPTPTHSASTAATPVPGSKISLSISKITPQPSSPSPVPAPTPIFPSTGQTFVAVIVGSTSTGQPIAQGPAGAIALENAAPLPKGAEIEFKVLSEPRAPSNTGQLPTLDPRAIVASGREWPAFDDVASALRENTPTLASQFNTHSMPQADTKLSSTLLFLMSALKGGDLKSWIGDTLGREIDRIRPDAMKRLRDDVRMFAGDGDEMEARTTRPAGEWRALPVPFAGDGLEQLRVLMRKDEEPGEDGERSNEETRFVVDLRMTSIGRIQLDGLIHVGERRFDMLVRTTSKLPDRFRQDVLGIFAAANEAVGMNGGLAFRAAPDALVEVETPSPRKPDGGIIV